MKDRKALVIEDQKDLSRLIKRTLEKAGFSDNSIDTAFDGETALKMISKSEEIKEPYAIITLDYSLPDMGGGTVYMQLIQSNLNTDNILVITGFQETPEELFGKYAKDLKDRIIRKPFDTHELINKIKKYC